MDKLIVTRWRGKVCTAVLAEGKISRIMLEPETEASLLNNIYIGKVQKIVGNINAAFIDIGKGWTGYYSLEENKSHIYVSAPGKKLKAGDEIVVQVSREGVKTKAPVLTGKLSFTGRYLVLTAGKTGIGFSSKINHSGYKPKTRKLLEEALGTSKEFLGVIVRTNGPEASKERLLQELETLKAQYEKLLADASCRTCYSCLYQSPPAYVSAIRDAYGNSLQELVTDVDIYHEQLERYLRQRPQEGDYRLTFYEDKLLPLEKLYSLDSVMEKALGKNVWLKSGGYLVIEPTEAMVVIDVNTGKYSGNKKLQDTIFKINMEAAGEIARQLQLRNLSGIIIIDFIDMEREEDREQLLRYLREIVSKDPVKTTVVDMTRLNLVELTRKKVRKPLYEQVLE
ncbi:MAG: ribonuclease E/G [Clostridium sp.]|nr:ribonuclease E/G [Clostridium sp.]